MYGIDYKLARWWKCEFLHINLIFLVIFWNVIGSRAMELLKGAAAVFWTHSGGIWGLYSSFWLHIDLAMRTSISHIFPYFFQISEIWLKPQPWDPKKAKVNYWRCVLANFEKCRSNIGHEIADGGKCEFFHIFSHFLAFFPNFWNINKSRAMGPSKGTTTLC